LFAKDRFDIDLHEDTVTCPNQRTAPIRRGAGVGCPLRAQRAKAAGGRSIHAGPCERQLAAARAVNATRTGSRTTGQPDPRWNARSGT